MILDLANSKYWKNPANKQWDQELHRSTHQTQNRNKAKCGISLQGLVEVPNTMVMTMCPPCVGTKRYNRGDPVVGTWPSVYKREAVK